MKCYLKSISTALPHRVQSNEELAEGIEGWSADKIRLKTGVISRRVAAPGETATDLAAQAAEMLLAQTSLPRSEIDTLIFCTQSADYLLPSSSCLLQHRLQLPTTCAAFDVMLGCSGYTYGLWLARSLILSGSATNILFLAGDTYTRYCNPRELATASLFGDGATATWISAEESGSLASIGHSVLGTDGRGEEHLRIRAGGSRHPETTESATRYLYMNGAEVASFAVGTVKRMVGDLLNRVGWTWEEVDHFVFHQANPGFVQRLSGALKLPAEKVPVDLADVGNTCSSTIPMTLQRCLESGRFHSGDRIILAGFGVGYSWGANALEWC